MNNRYRTIVNWLKKLQTPQQQDTVFDFGCGKGELICTLSKVGYSVMGLDIDRDKVKRLRHRYKQKALCLDMRDPIALDQTFKFVLCCEVLEHFKPEEMETVIQNIRRAVCPNGYILLTFPKNIDDIETNEEHQQHITVEKILSWFWGFRLISCEFVYKNAAAAERESPNVLVILEPEGASESVNIKLQSGKGERVCSKRTICEVHRQIYDVLITQTDDKKLQDTIIPLLEEAFDMGVRLVDKLVAHNISLLNWEKIEDRGALKELRALRNKIHAGKLR